MQPKEKQRSSILWSAVLPWYLVSSISNFFCSASSCGTTTHCPISACTNLGFRLSIWCVKQSVQNFWFQKSSLTRVELRTALCAIDICFLEGNLISLVPKWNALFCLCWMSRLLMMSYGCHIFSFSISDNVAWWIVLLSCVSPNHLKPHCCVVASCLIVWLANCNSLIWKRGTILVPLARFMIRKLDFFFSRKCKRGAPFSQIVLHNEFIEDLWFDLMRCTPSVPK